MPEKPLVFKDLSDSVAIVTGGGRGLGRAIALALAEQGVAVSIIGRTPDVLAETAEAIDSAGGRAMWTVGDVCSSDEVRRLVTTTSERFGQVRILVNNAAMQMESLAFDTPDDVWEDVIRTNLTAPFICSREVGGAMKENGGGSIINIASVFALRGTPRYSAYSASKGGLLSLTRSLAVEWARYKIRVNAIAAGHFATSANEKDLQVPELEKLILSRIPARRVADPSELGATVCFLASCQSDFITGSTVTIDGGLSVA
jgi:NAD(P)-dependent dehydrogenase (short-subunit alcohol dehydrogenase family)